MKLSILTILATAALTTQASAYNCGLKGLHETACMKVEKYCPATISSSDLNTIKEKQGFEANGVKFDVEGKPFTKTASGDVSLFSGRWSATKTTTPKVVCMYTDQTGGKVGKNSKAFISLGTKITKEVDHKVAELEKEARKVAMDANTQNPAEKLQMRASEEPAKDQTDQEKNIQTVSATEAAPQAEQHPAEAGVKVEGASATAAPEAGQTGNVEKVSSYDNIQAPMGNMPTQGGKPVDGMMPATVQGSTTGESGKPAEGFTASTGGSYTGSSSTGAPGYNGTNTSVKPSEEAATSTGTTGSAGVTGSAGTTPTTTNEGTKMTEGVTPATTTEDAGKKAEGFQAGTPAGSTATPGNTTTGGSH